MSERFKNRSCEPELMDAPDIPKDALFRNLYELDFINHTLGGHAITIDGIKKLVTDKNREYHIVDIGCGGGDAMLAIARWARKNNYKVRITGVDINAHAVAYANEYCEKFKEISIVKSDYRDFLSTAHVVDVVHCSLFCHHLKDDELVELLNNLRWYSAVGFVINDLQRHWFAYHSIKLLTRWFSSSELVKNDAPLSVLRGFSKDEIHDLLNKSNVGSATLLWKWAFRYLIVYQKEKINGFK